MSCATAYRNSESQLIELEAGFDWQARISGIPTSTRVASNYGTKVRIHALQRGMRRVRENRLGTLCEV